MRTMEGLGGRKALRVPPNLLLVPPLKMPLQLLALSTSSANPISTDTAVHSTDIVSMVKRTTH